MIKVKITRVILAVKNQLNLFKSLLFVLNFRSNFIIRQYPKMMFKVLDICNF
jgi:hypothetical protein